MDSKAHAIKTGAKRDEDLAGGPGWRAECVCKIGFIGDTAEEADGLLDNHIINGDAWDAAAAKRRG